MSFKPIPSQPNYTINPEGIVKSISRSAVRSDGKTFDYPSQVIKPYMKNNKPYVQLYRDGKKVCVSVSKLLKETFT